MKDMERWAKIQNRQKDSVRSPFLRMGMDDDRRQSKTADAGFAIFERKVRDSSSTITFILCIIFHNECRLKYLFIISLTVFVPVLVWDIFRYPVQMIFLRSPLLLLRKMKSQR